MIKNKSYVLPSSTTLSKTMLTKYINSFWTDIFSSPDLITNNHLLLLVKITFINGDVITLAELRKANFADKDLLLEYLANRLNILAESYQVDPISEINFNYIIKDGLAEDSRALLQSNDYQVGTPSFNNMQIPNTMDIYQYGDILVHQDKGDQSKYAISNGNRMYIIESQASKNKVNIPKPIDLTWTDTELSESLFKREICKDTLYYLIP